MFTGCTEHFLDNKNRFFLPRKLTKLFGRTRIAVLTGGLERCLFFYPQPTWQKVLTRLDKLPSLGKKDVRTFKRLFLANVTNVNIDQQGRLLIPRNLTRYAGINKKIVVLGVAERIEIWAVEKWVKYQQQGYRTYTRVAENLEI